MDSNHLRSHLADLQSRINFLRTMKPDNPSYKLWLGDVIEVVNLQWGVQSPQMEQLRAAIAAGRGHPLGDPDEALRTYLHRLNDLDAVLESLQGGLGAPLPLVDEAPLRRNGDRHG